MLSPKQQRRPLPFVFILLLYVLVPYLLDDKLGEGGELAGQGDVETMAQPQAAIGPLATGVHLSLHRHQEQGLGAPGYSHRVQGGEDLKTGNEK